MASRGQLEFIGGSLAGGCGVLVGQPFDTLKVRLQSGQFDQAGRPSTVAAALRNTVQAEGARALFKGLLAPLLSTSLLNAIVFSVKGWTLRALHGPAASQPQFAAPLSSIAASGALAGAVSTIIGTPAELLKCQLQVRKGEIALGAGNVAVARQLLREGGVLALYRGQTTMLCRETLAFATYFTVYEVVKRGFNPYMSSSEGSQVANPMFVQMFAGAVTGICTWGLVCPIDVLKTRVQTARCNGPPLRIPAVIADLSREPGGLVRGLYRGIVPSLMRGVPTNMVMFPVYEGFMRFASPESR
jgi:hypothetical protein